MTRKESILEELKNDDEKLILLLALATCYKDVLEKAKKDEEYKDVLEEKIKELNEEIGEG